jgi:hypothetical protein
LEFLNAVLEVIVVADVEKGCYEEGNSDECGGIAEDIVPDGTG